MLSRYSSYILCLLVAVFAVILYLNDFGPVAGLERNLNDLLLRFTATSDVRPNVALVTIDGKAQTALGKWPWNRDKLADLLAAVATGEPAAIAVDIELPDEAEQDSAGYTNILADQLSWIDKAVLSYDIAPATFRSNKTSNPKYLFTNSMVVSNKLGEMGDGSCINSRKVFLPAEKLMAAQSHLGFTYDAPDNDHVLRRQPMFMNYEGYYYPSLTLRTAAVYLGVSTDQIKIVEGREIQLDGKRTIPTNSNGQYFVKFAKSQPFQNWSAADVLTKGFDLTRLKGKAVIISADDPSANETFATPVGKAVPSAIVKATVLENIINQNMLVPPQGTSLALLIIMFLLGGTAALLLPLMAPTYRILLILGGLVVLMNVNYLLLSQFNTLPNTIYIGLELFLLMIAAPFLDSELLTGVAPASAKSHRSGARGKAHVRETDHPTDGHQPAVREIRSRSTDPENQATAALDQGDASSGRIRTTAHDSFDHQTISGEIELNAGESTSGTPQDGIFAGADSSRNQRAVQVAEPPAFDSGNATDSGGFQHPPEIEPSRSTVGATDLKNLGRYQIIGTLGKGAMGTVYKGIDPAINRPVALKTIRLDFVNDPAELAELKERLYREAQAAGKLSHPNIVTIYDVGSEASLQYIAMEYLEGQTLEELIKKKTKFNYKIIAQMIIQICNALTYAHDRGIVHRDIKPANIMVLKDYSVKVMDFGIARIDSNSMTKTGIAMGTPNYISPEQLRGLSTDRRADLFSLGVVVYELLLGRRPFRGENITSLIYAIMNMEPEKPSTANQHIPMLFDHVVSRALKKDPNERYQKATEIVADLQAFVESFAVRT
jgi:serine/threonine-protein kinase